MKVKKIYIDGYKNLVDCTAELHDFNILVGPNNSGKSNFLEIFGFLNGVIFGSADLKKAIFEQAAPPRGEIFICHTDKQQCKPISISLLVEIPDSRERYNELEYSMNIQCTTPPLKKKNKDQVGFISELLTFKDKGKPGKAEILIKREGDSLRVRTKSGNFARRKIENITSFWSVLPSLFPDPNLVAPNILFAAVRFIEILSVSVLFASPDGLRENIGKGGQSPFEQIRPSSFDLIESIAKIFSEKKLFEQYRAALCQILDLEDARFFTIDVPPSIRKDSKDMPKVINFFELKMPGQPYSNIRNFSDGTLMVVAILVMLLSPEREGPLLCVEEPENCLHPKALKTLLSYLNQKSKDVQILITTHSPYVLNHVNPEDVIVASLHEDGGARFGRIKDIKDLRKRLVRGFISFGDMLETEFEEEEVAI